MTTIKVPLFRSREEEEAFEKKCQNNEWKLIRKDTGEEVKRGDTVQLDGQDVTVTHLEPPRHMASTGHVNVRDRAGVGYRYYAGVFDLKYV